MRDASEFDDFYAATSRRIVGDVYAMCGDIGSAEDAVAEAYLRAWTRWRTVSRARSPEAWVRAVATRQAISGWRKRVNRRRAHDLVASDAARTTAEVVGPDHVALVEALRHISAEQRRAIVLHHLVGLSVAEIAEETGAPTGTVKARLSRGRAALAGLLDDSPPGPAPSTGASAPHPARPTKEPTR